VATLGAVQSVTRTGFVVLDPSEWQPAAERHAARVEPWVGPHLERRRHGVPHPVEDFLFTYYSHRPAALRRWHPGFGFALVGGEERSALKGYGDLAGVTGRPGAVGVTADHVRAQRPVLEALRRLLAATLSRTPHFGCFGLHEWAMVYRLDPDEVRHAAWPLRLGASGTDEVVESSRVACSHFDAFRFFTERARPLNVLQPGRDDRAAFEQPACLHAGMDLYKHAFRLSPMVPSELVADCFELAREIRVLDMRASPYDLSELGYEPVRIETAEGKQEYTAAQRRFAERGRPLRQRLLVECERLLTVAS
jgi:hypothetical protein